MRYDSRIFVTVSSIFHRAARPFAKSNPLCQLALTYAPLATDFERGQIVLSDHSLQGTRGDMEHLRGFGQSKQPETFRFFFHRITPKRFLSNADAI
jgi:hypothetical protein